MKNKDKKRPVSNFIKKGFHLLYFYSFRYILLFFKWLGNLIVIQGLTRLFQLFGRFLLWGTPWLNELKIERIKETINQKKNNLEEWKNKEITALSFTKPKSFDRFSLTRQARVHKSFERKANRYFTQKTNQKQKMITRLEKSFVKYEPRALKQQALYSKRHEAVQIKIVNLAEKQEAKKLRNQKNTLLSRLMLKLVTYIHSLFESMKNNARIKKDRRVHKYLNWEEKDTRNFLVNNAIYIVILTLIIIIIINKPAFLSINVFKNILTQSSVRLILAFGVGGIIILQGTDLSLGRSVGFAAIISGSLLQAQNYASRFYADLPVLPLILPLIVAMLVSAFFSAINGFVVAKFKIHPFLATLGASVALYGILSMYFASGDPGPQPIGGFDPRYTLFVNGTFNIFGIQIPNLIVYASIVTVLVWIVWNKTTFGKNMYAVGGNPEAAKISGVNVLKTIVFVYIFAGLLYGMGGFLEAARIGSVSNGTGTNYELDAIAACVVGGISFSGGIGKISGAVTGVLMFTIISYGMNFMGLDVFYQYIIKGVIIVAAVALDTRKYIIKT